jgi:hypothetical protein
MQSIDIPITVVSEPGHPEIARLAAQLWEKRGRPANRDEEIWLEAERQLLKTWLESQPGAAPSGQAKSNGHRKSRLMAGMRPAGMDDRTSTNSGRFST